MAKGIYVGVGEQTVQGNVIPKNWAVVDKNYYNSFICEGIKLTGNGISSSVSNSISYAVDGDLSTYWKDNGDNVNQWLQLEFPNAIKITKMKTYISRTLYNFTNVKIQGSNDNSTWTDLYTLTTFQTALTEITLSNTNYYKYYRIYYTFPSSSVGKATVYELQTTEYVAPPNIARKVKKAYVGVGENSLVVNGDFSDGLNGWTAGTSYSLMTLSADAPEEKAGSNSLSLTYTDTTVASARRPFETPTVVDHKYYLSLWIKIAINETITSISILPFGVATNVHLVLSSSDLPAVGIWTHYSLLNTATKAPSETLNSLVLRVSDSTGSDTVLFNDYMCYDLTALYGAGNEPTLEWCDANIETLKELYKSQNSKARKVKKGYIGVAGIARPFFSAEQKLQYYGTAENLSAKRQRLAATSIGDYALFGGGDGSSYSAVVDTYTSSLVKGTATKLSTPRYCLAATSVGNYALFGGGDGGNSVANVDTYDANLVKGTATALSVPRHNLVATNIGDYALFGGGYSNNDGKSKATVDTYDVNLVKGTTTSLASGVENLAATSIGDYALLGGGNASNSTSGKKYVDTYTSSLVKGTAADLSIARTRLAATSIGDYALFGGGASSDANYKTVDTYTASLVKGTATNFSVAKKNLAATSVGDYALFSGGYNSDYSAVVDTYTKELVKGVATDLSVGRHYLAATSIGDYALFGGGLMGSSTYSNAVDVYQVV